MRVLNPVEIDQVSGGWTKITPAQRALPGADVTDLSGNRTGWCRGYGNMKNGMPKHEATNVPCNQGKPV